MLLAARALAEEAGNAALTVNGAAAQGPARSAPLTPAEVKDGALTIANDGDAPVDAVVSVIGAALTPEPAVSKGFTIERTYYTLDGKKVDLASATGGTGQLKQNDRLVVVLKVDVAGDGRPHPAGRPPAGRPRDREPAPRRLRRHQDARLAEDHGEAASTPTSATTASSPPSTSSARATAAAAGATPTATRRTARR